MENRHSLIGVLPTQFGATVDCDAESHFKNQFAHYWFTSSEKFLPNAAVTFLKHSSLWSLKFFLIHDITSDLVSPLHVSGRTFFQDGYSTGEARSCFSMLFSFDCDIPD